MYVHIRFLDFPMLFLTSPHLALPLLLLLQVDAASTCFIRPHSWSLSMAMGALEVLDLDPYTKYRTVVTRKKRRRALAHKEGQQQQQQQQMMVVGDYRVPKNADLKVDFNPR